MTPKSLSTLTSRHSDKEQCRKKSSWNLLTFSLLNLFKPLDEFQLPFLGLSSHGLHQVQCLEGKCATGVNSPGPSCAPARRQEPVFSFMVLFIGLLSFALTPLLWWLAGLVGFYGPTASDPQRLNRGEMGNERRGRLISHWTLPSWPKSEHRHQLPRDFQKNSCCQWILGFCPR